MRAWWKGFRRVEVESDSIEAIDLVKEGCAENHPSADLTKEIKRWLNKNWEVRIISCFREETRVAHGLATAVTATNSSNQTFDDSPEVILGELRRDLGLRNFTRWVSG